MGFPNRMNDYGQLADITMAEAVQYLSSGDVNYQHYGASFIQHSTYSEDKAKQEVRTQTWVSRTRTQQHCPVRTSNSFTCLSGVAAQRNPSSGELAEESQSPGPTDSLGRPAEPCL